MLGAVFSMLSSTPATAQTGPFKHIIIVVQENRTPDNLFGANPSAANCRQEDPFETGVDIVDGGPVQGQSNTKCFVSLPLNGWDASKGVAIDPDHSYDGQLRQKSGNAGWVADYDYGNMDGFCQILPNSYPYCPSYSYVQRTDVQPYFDIAKAYGFSNYMFQSNEGPSMEAHQFLFTGTSAPVEPGDPTGYDKDFAAELAIGQGYPGGCPYDPQGSGNQLWPNWVLPTGTEVYDPRAYSLIDPASECYTHDSLVTDAADCNQNNNCNRSTAPTWRYYTEPPSPNETAGFSIWDTPAWIPEACYGQTTSPGLGYLCTGPEWSIHVRIPQENGYSWAPIFDDILACDLPAISWVIPDQAYSDHPYWPGDGGNAGSTAIGPSWVGDIVDAIGQSASNSGGLCDYWGTSKTAQHIEPTAIFVVWDDWGGWYDHVVPWIARQENPNGGYTACDPNTQWGCGYTDGFRVPLLVVSEYTYNPQTGGGYVSGACGTGEPNQCPYFGKSSDYVFGEYTHDFGSILAYTEWNFGFNPQGIVGPPGYADWNAPDWSTDHQSHVPLSDFFNWPGSGQPFTAISTPHPYTCFTTHQAGNDNCPLQSGQPWNWQATPPDSY
jgi:phospholipase C